MTSRLRSQRVWRLFERFPRELLYRIVQTVSASFIARTRKHDLIEALCVLPEVMLEHALAEGLTWRDLQALCKRINRASYGTKAELAARILAAVDEPATRPARWRSFAEARAFARRLELTSSSEWNAFVRGRLPAKRALPADIPKAPHTAYAKAGWTTWGDFLGTGYVAHRMRAYRPFRQARAYARSLGLTNRAEWRAFCLVRSGGGRLLPPDIPATPHGVYANRGWISYGDWLGTGRMQVSKYQYRSYQEACTFVRTLGIRTVRAWRAYLRGELDGYGPRPLDIPSNPQRTYCGCGWMSWGQFFGTHAIAPRNRVFRSFADARSYMRKQGLRTYDEWRAWLAAGNRPADIPSVPDRTYHGQGWVSWRDFLGTPKVDPVRIRRRRFAAARAFVRRLGLRTRSEYRQAWRDGHIPQGIPMKIERYPEWKGWADFLGPSYAGHRPRAAPPARTRGRRG